MVDPMPSQPMPSQPMPPRRNDAAPSDPRKTTAFVSTTGQPPGPPAADADAVPEAGPNATPALSDLLTGHLGPDAALLPVATVTWPPFEHVNVQGAVDR